MANRCNWLRPLRRCSPNIGMPWLKRGERRGNSVKKTLQDITKELLRDIHLQWVFPFPAMCMKRMAALLPSNGCGHQTFLRYLLNWYPSLLLGGFEPGVEAETMLSTFWKQYRLNHPSHAVFSQNFAKHRCIPLNLHGDGARTQKKQPLEVVSLEAVLGLDSFKCKQCHCDDCDCPAPLGASAANQCGNPLVQCLNHRYHTYLSRFLVFAFPSKEIKMPGLLEALLKMTADDLGWVCNNGLDTTHGHWNFAVLGYKGDMEYHAKLKSTAILCQCWSYKSDSLLSWVPSWGCSSPFWRPKSISFLADYPVHILTLD